MAELVSPGVLVKEKDLTVSVRGDATSIGGIGIMATDGPVNEVITVEDENQLADIFGKPNGTNYQYWFTAANFLLYSNTLKVLRMETTGMKNARVRVRDNLFRILHPMKLAMEHTVRLVADRQLALVNMQLVGLVHGVTMLKWHGVLLRRPFIKQLLPPVQQTMQ